MEKKWTVFLYGDVNIDIIVPNVRKIPQPGVEEVIEKMESYIGGGAALTAMGLGKLNINTVFKGKVGSDCYGTFIREEFKKNKIDTSLLMESREKKTGISLSFTDKSDRSFITYRGTNEELDLNNILQEDMNKAAHIHITGYSGSNRHKEYEEILKKINQSGNTTVSFDVGWDDSGEWCEKIFDLFPYIDILFMNETEALHYSRTNTIEEAIHAISTKNKTLVIKMGKKGSVAVKNGKTVSFDGYKVEAVDTTGAGDSFNAGFLYGFLKNAPLETCLQYGNGCGALSVTALGGNTAFPKEEELIEFITKEKGKGIK